MAQQSLNNLSLTPGRENHRLSSDFHTHAHVHTRMFLCIEFFSVLPASSLVTTWRLINYETQSIA